MNTKRLIFCAVTVLCCLSGFAQRKQTTEECTVHLDGIAFGGKMTYGYIVDEDGEHIRDGALSIIVNNRENSFYENDYRNFKLVGNYKLNANFQKGLLHGPMTMNANFKGDVRNYLERKQGSLTWSFQGNFANGLPHGNFNIQYNGETPRKLIATFNKGVLVGQIKCLYLDKGIYSEGNYSMNSKGELHGKSGSMEFINGVLVNKTSSGKSTPPRLVELAKKYANKTITEEELMKQDIIVLEDHIDLEKVIYDVIIESGLIDFENHIKRWDFTTPNIKKYKYLKEIEKEPSFKDEISFDLFCKEYCKSINDNYKKEIIVQDPENKKYYIIGSFQEYRDHITPKLKYEVAPVSITKEQYVKLEKAIHDIRTQQIRDITDFIDSDDIYNKGYGRSSRNYQVLSHFMSVLNDNSISSKETFNIHLIRKQMEEFISYFKQKIESCDLSSRYLLIPHNEEITFKYETESIIEKNKYKILPINTKGIYINSNSYEDWNITNKLLFGEYNELTKSMNNQEREKIDAKMSRIKQMLIPTETFINTFNNRIGTKFLELTTLRMYIEGLPSPKELKTFGKIASYQILESPIGELNKIYVRVANKKGMTIDLKWDTTKEFDSQR